MMAAVLDALAPPPLGAYPFNEDVFQMFVVFVVLFVLDRALVLPRLHRSSRYFALHVVANAISAACAFPDVVRAFANPLDCLTGPSHTMWANSAVAAIHVYHVAFFALKPDEVFHHALFVTILCGLAIPLKQVSGVGNNLGCFFLSGLPGGLDYVMLVGVKNGWLDVMTEKRWNSRINTWLRGPAMVYYAVLAYLAWLSGRHTMPTAALIVSAALHFHNGQYYNSEANVNYGFRLAEEKRK